MEGGLWQDDKKPSAVSLEVKDDAQGRQQENIPSYRLDLNSDVNTPLVTNGTFMGKEGLLLLQNSLNAFEEIHQSRKVKTEEGMDVVSLVCATNDDHHEQLQCYFDQEDTVKTTHYTDAACNIVEGDIRIVKMSADSVVSDKFPQASVGAFEHLLNVKQEKKDVRKKKKAFKTLSDRFNVLSESDNAIDAVHKDLTTFTCLKKDVFSSVFTEMQKDLNTITPESRVCGEGSKSDSLDCTTFPKQFYGSIRADNQTACHEEYVEDGSTPASCADKVLHINQAKLPVSEKENDIKATSLSLRDAEKVSLTGPIFKEDQTECNTSVVDTPLPVAVAVRESVSALHALQEESLVDAKPMSLIDPGIQNVKSKVANAKVPNAILSRNGTSGSLPESLPGKGRLEDLKSLNTQPVVVLFDVLKSSRKRKCGGFWIAPKCRDAFYVSTTPPVVSEIQSVCVSLPEIASKTEFIVVDELPTETSTATQYSDCIHTHEKKRKPPLCSYHKSTSTLNATSGSYKRMSESHVDIERNKRSVKQLGTISHEWKHETECEIGTKRNSMEKTSLKTSGNKPRADGSEKMLNVGKLSCKRTKTSECVKGDTTKQRGLKNSSTESVHRETSLTTDDGDGLLKPRRDEQSRKGDARHSRGKMVKSGNRKNNLSGSNQADFGLAAKYAGRHKFGSNVNNHRRAQRRFWNHKKNHKNIIKLADIKADDVSSKEMDHLGQLERELYAGGKRTKGVSFASDVHCSRQAAANENVGKAPSAITSSGNHLNETELHYTMSGSFPLTKHATTIKNDQLRRPIGSVLSHPRAERLDEITRGTSSPRMESFNTYMTPPLQDTVLTPENDQGNGSVQTSYLHQYSHDELYESCEPLLTCIAVLKDAERSVSSLEDLHSIQRAISIVRMKREGVMSAFLKTSSACGTVGVGHDLVNPCLTRNTSCSPHLPRSKEQDPRSITDATSTSIPGIQDSDPPLEDVYSPEIDACMLLGDENPNARNGSEVNSTLCQKNTRRKKTAPETAGIFHGRTLLRGGVEPRGIPLNPVEKCRVVPSDPRRHQLKYTKYFSDHVETNVFRDPRLRKIALKSIYLEANV